MNVRARCRGALLTTAIVVVPLIGASSASAATLPVTCASGAPGIVAAINSANTTAAADTIELEAPCTYTMTTAAAPAGGNDTGLPIINQPLTINGHGATIQRSTAAGTPNFRLIFAWGNPVKVPVELNDLILSNGKLGGASQHGAGIAALGVDLKLEKVTLNNNATTTAGGSPVSSGGGLAILLGSAVIDHSNFQLNGAVNGGGLWSQAAAVTVRRSSFIANGATSSSGAALIQGGTAIFENDTISFNAATNGIGGIGVIDNGANGSVAVTVNSSTLTDNSNNFVAGTAPGSSLAAVKVTAANTVTINLRNTIVTDTDSTAAALIAPCFVFGGAVITGTGGGNLEWPTNTCPAGTRADPKLTALALSGGTWAYGLQPTSPAIDLGGAVCPATDQRDKSRPDGDACDSGAIEVNPPQTSATGPSGPTNAPHLTFTSDEANSTFQCRIDSGAFAACNSPVDPVGLSEGSHTFQVRATDTDGYTDPSPATVAFTVDTIAPVVEITQGPGALTNDSTPAIEFTVDDPSAAVKCSVDGETPQPCGSPFTTQTLDDGSHTIVVSAADAAGNSGSDAVSFDVDASAPDTTITSGPNGTIYTDSTSFSFDSDEAGATFECQLDGDGFAGCSSPHALEDLGEGEHTFEVRAIDAAGNVDGSPDSATFTYVNDTDAPVLTITESPASPTNDPTATVVFTVDDPSATITCTVDGGSAASCASPFTTGELDDGEHSVTILATDPAGNPAEATATFVLDTSAPETTITDGPNGTIEESEASFSFISSESESTFECKLDTGDWADCDSPELLNVSEGTHTFSVRATDLAGNTDQSPDSRTFTYSNDATAPVVDITVSPNSPTNNPVATVAFTVDDPAATVSCKIDNQSPQPCGSPFSTPALGDGPHQITVTAIDSSDNTGSDSVAWVLDTQAPDTTITGGPANGSTVYSDQTSFLFSSNEVASSFECRLDGGAWSACSSPKTLSGYSSGTHTFQVRARDAAGNQDPSPASRSFTYTRCVLIRLTISLFGQPITLCL